MGEGEEAGDRRTNPQNTDWSWRRCTDGKKDTLTLIATPLTMKLLVIDIPLLLLQVLIVSVDQILISFILLVLSIVICVRPDHIFFFVYFLSKTEFSSQSFCDPISDYLSLLGSSALSLSLSIYRQNLSLCLSVLLLKPISR